MSSNNGQVGPPIWVKKFVWIPTIAYDVEKKSRKLIWGTYALRCLRQTVVPLGFPYMYYYVKRRWCIRTPSIAAKLALGVIDFWDLDNIWWDTYLETNRHRIPPESYTLIEKERRLVETWGA